VGKFLQARQKLQIAKAVKKKSSIQRGTIQKAEGKGVETVASLLPVFPQKSVPSSSFLSKNFLPDL
jgi:hypothetical protein